MSIRAKNSWTGFLQTVEWKVSLLSTLTRCRSHTPLVLRMCEISAVHLGVRWTAWPKRTTEIESKF